MNQHRHLRRLDRIWDKRPIYFITTTTRDRRAILAQPSVAAILIDELRNAELKHGWIIGRYVVMPDHVHFFAGQTGNEARSLSRFMQQWKQWTSKRILRELSALDREPVRAPIWQPEFFDHLLRSWESYEKKWEYVRQNPVRAGLAPTPEHWPWQGELNVL